MDRHNGLGRRPSVQAQLICLATLLATTTIGYAFVVDNVHLLIPLGPIGEIWDYDPRIFSQEGVVTIMLTLNVSRNVLASASHTHLERRSSSATGLSGGAFVSCGR